MALLWSLLVQGAAAQSSASAVISDQPQDRQHPARMQVVHIPSHGLNINGVLYLAAGAGAHPTVILFHGMPGNEQNLDLAQAIRRAGWNVLTLHFRGSWGSPGTYSYHHMLEDAHAALDFVRDPIMHPSTHWIRSASCWPVTAPADSSRLRQWPTRAALPV